MWVNIYSGRDITMVFILEGGGGGTFHNILLGGGRSMNIEIWGENNHN